MSIEPPRIFATNEEGGPPRKLAVLTSGGDSAGASSLFLKPREMLGRRPDLRCRKEADDRFIPL
jgi:hypothetical protein